MVDVPDKNAPFRALIDSTTMLTIARFVWPPILLLLGYLGSMQLTDLKEGQKQGLAELRDGQRQVWTQISKMNETQTSTNNVQFGLVAKVDAVKQQVDHMQIQVDGMAEKH